MSNTAIHRTRSHRRTIFYRVLCIIIYIVSAGKPHETGLLPRRATMAVLQLRKNPRHRPPTRRRRNPTPAKENPFGDARNAAASAVSVARSANASDGYWTTTSSSPVTKPLPSGRCVVGRIRLRRRCVLRPLFRKCRTQRRCNPPLAFRPIISDRRPITVK